MKLLLSWLKDHIECSESVSEIASILTQTGLEVENIEKQEIVKGGLKGVVIGEVKTCEPHPNADRLKLTTVDIGNATLLPIVCGASNIAKGQKVLVATVGTTLYPISKEPISIAKTKIRGEVSEGMICAEDELGIGTSHEGIMVLSTSLPNGTSAADYFNWKEDYILEIGLTPNRADAASHRGTARDLKAYFQKELKPFDYSSLDIIKPIKSNLSIHIAIENKEACKRYTGVLLTNITVKASPTWLKQRLESIGVKSINNIVDITNYILHDIGQPLHAFDADKIAGGKITVKALPANTLFTTLDGVERKLNAFDCMICDEEKPLCMAGILGGLSSGVSNQTKNIFIESAYFSPASIRKTAQAHGLKTDASFRYERGTDPRITSDALKKAILLIKELAGGDIASEMIDIYPNPIQDTEIPITYNYIWNLIGHPIEKKQIHEILQHLDIKILSHNENEFIASVPPYRVDISTRADITEEILRIYGVNQIPFYDKLSAAFLAEFPITDKNKLKNNIANLLTSRGFYQIVTNSLTKTRQNDSWISEDKSLNPVVISNPLSAELAILRTTMLFSGLEVIQYNIHRKQKKLSLFEFGKVYAKQNQNYLETEKLALFSTGQKTEETWLEENREVTFFDIKSTLSVVFEKIGLKPDNWKPITNSIFTYGVEIWKNKKNIGTAGHLSKHILKEADIKQPVFFAELNWELLVEAHTPLKKINEISKYPEVRRDLSLVMDEHIPFEEVHRVAFQTERKKLKTINVFNTYQGDHLEKGKKSYAVSFILQDFEKTLTDNEIDQLMNNLIGAFEKELYIIIRK